jgi:hypothetical protein
MLEAGVRQFGEWGSTDEGRHILIAVARYLAAHSPTERAALQTADIARRLMRGGELHQEATAWLRSRETLAYPIPENASTAEIIHQAVAKIIVFTGLYYALVWCARNYNARPLHGRSQERLGG